MSQRRNSTRVRNEKRPRAGDVHALGAKRAARCPHCGLVALDGTWRKARGRLPADLVPQPCPACRRVRGRQSAELVRAGGAFALLHREEILNRVGNVEAKTRAERPLEWIIRIEETDESISISTTSEHLAARIAKALKSDFGGNLVLRYAPDEKFATAHWTRED